MFTYTSFVQISLFFAHHTPTHLEYCAVVHLSCMAIAYMSKFNIELGLIHVDQPECFKINLEV